MFYNKLKIFAYAVVCFGFSANLFAVCPSTISYEDAQKLAGGEFITVGGQRFHPEDVGSLPSSSLRLLTRAIFNPTLTKAENDVWKGDVCTYSFSTAKDKLVGNQKSFTIRSAK